MGREASAAFRFFQWVEGLRESHSAISTQTEGWTLSRRTILPIISRCVSEDVRQTPFLQYHLPYRILEPTLHHGTIQMSQFRYRQLTTKVEQELVRSPTAHPVRRL